MTDHRHDSDEPHDLHDEQLERIVQELRPLPGIDPEAKARVLVAVAAERGRTIDGSARRRALRITGFVAVAAGLLAVVVVSRGGIADRHPGTATGAGPASSAPNASLAGNAGAIAETMAVPVQLVVRAPSAKRMAVVGDFTGWDEGRVPMTRDAASGLWSATVSVRPGRHVYAFVADDSVWMRDPRAPVATDADFGRPGSLLLVGRP